MLLFVLHVIYYSLNMHRAPLMSIAKTALIDESTECPFSEKEWGKKEIREKIKAREKEAILCSVLNHVHL